MFAARADHDAVADDVMRPLFDQGLLVLTAGLRLIETELERDGRIRRDLEQEVIYLVIVIAVHRAGKRKMTRRENGQEDSMHVIIGREVTSDYGWIGRAERAEAIV